MPSQSRISTLRKRTPVTLPPRREMIRATRPSATTSAPFANAIGILAVSSEAIGFVLRRIFPRQNRLGGPGLHHVGSAVRAETLNMKVAPVGLKGP